MIDANHLCAIEYFFHNPILHRFCTEVRSEPCFSFVFVTENDGGVI